MHTKSVRFTVGMHHKKDGTSARVATVRVTQPFIRVALTLSLGGLE